MCPAQSPPHPSPLPGGVRGPEKMGSRVDREAERHAATPAFPYLRLRLTVRPQHGARDAIPDAERVRRAFGRELIQRFCPFGKPHCQDTKPVGACPQLSTCPFAQVFARFGTARPPFALFTAHGIEHDTGTAIVDVTLFGKGCTFFPWVVRTLEDAFAKGIGGWPSTWRVTGVYRLHGDVRGNGKHSRLILGPEAPTPELVPDSMLLDPQAGDADLHHDPRPVAVELLSPARLVYERRVLDAHDPVPFAALVARATDRLRDLYGDAAVAGVAQRTGNRDPAAVPLVADHTHFVRKGDYSTKKRRLLPLDGKQGTLVYGPGAAAFLPLLRAAEITHVGKNAAAGLGRIRVRLLDCAVTRLDTQARGRRASDRPSREVRRLGLKAQATYRHPSRGEDSEWKPKDTFRHPSRGGDNLTASR